jgi:hypothetical protein
MPSPTKTTRIFGPATGGAMVHAGGGATENFGHPEAPYSRPNAPVISPDLTSPFSSLAPILHLQAPGSAFRIPVGTAIPSSTGGASVVFRPPGAFR